MRDIERWLTENPHPIRGTLIPLLNERVGDPVREAWEERPWWTQWRDHWRWILRPMRPDPGKAIDKFRKRIESERVAEAITARIPVHMWEVVDVDPHPMLSSQVRVTVDVDESVDEARPIYEAIVGLGWTLDDDPRDEYNGRRFRFERDDSLIEVYLLAKVWGGSCEVVRHEVETTETEYEVVCAGEKEIREAADG